MTEPTIQELIDEVVQHSWDITLAKGSKFAIARSALLSRITQLQSDLEDEQKAHDKIARICFKTGVDTDDGSSVSAVRNLAKMVSQIQQESSEWHKMADELAGELNVANSKIYSVSWEDASESSPAWIAYCNLRDRKGIKTSSDNNKQRYPHAYPSEKASVEGTEVKE